MNEITTLLQQLVAIDSVNPDLVAGGAGAHAVIEWADLDQVQQCSDVLLATIQNFCA